MLQAHDLPDHDWNYEHASAAAERFDTTLEDEIDRVLSNKDSLGEALAWDDDGMLVDALYSFLNAKNAPAKATVEVLRDRLREAVKCYATQCAEKQIKHEDELAFEIELR